MESSPSIRLLPLPGRCYNIYARASFGPDTQPLHPAHCNRVSTYHVGRLNNVVLVVRGPG